MSDHWERFDGNGRERIQGPPFRTAWERHLMSMSRGEIYNLCHYLISEQMELGVDSSIGFREDDVDREEGFTEHFYCKATGDKIS